MNDNLIEDPEHKLNLRHLKSSDYPDLKKLMDRVYPGLGGAWTEKQFKAQLAVFPDGQIGIEDHGVIIAVAFSVILDYDKFGDQHSSAQITERCLFNDSRS